MNSNSCIFEFDKSFDVDFLVGTDEAGRGPAAGGVFAAAVHINDFEIAKDLSKLNDSKKLSAKVREELYDVILNNTINSVVCVEVEDIEKYNILNCSLKAMKLSCEEVINKSVKKIPQQPLINDYQSFIRQSGMTKGSQCHQKETQCHPEFISGSQEREILNQVQNDNKVCYSSQCHPEFISGSQEQEIRNQVQGDNTILTIVDGNKLIRNYDYPQEYIIKGDSKSASIAAASVLAKVTRDRYMQRLHEEYPQYNWAKNAGYLTKEHIEAIKKYGITKYHRKSFLKNILNPKTEQLSLL